MLLRKLLYVKCVYVLSFCMSSCVKFVCVKLCVYVSSCVKFVCVCEVMCVCVMYVMLSLCV